MQSLDEQATIAPLLVYAPFARFWRQQRPKIRAPLVWMFDPDAPADGVNSPMSDGSTWIRLKHMPTTLDDAHTVAHELGHSLLDQDGYPSLAPRDPQGAPDGLRILAAVLNGVLDLEIDRRLRSVGFRGDRLMTLDLFVQSLHQVFPPTRAGVLVDLVRSTGYDAPQKVRRFFMGALPTAPSAGALAILEQQN